MLAGNMGSLLYGDVSVMYSIPAWIIFGQPCFSSVSIQVVTILDILSSSTGSTHNVVECLKGERLIHSIKLQCHFVEHQLRFLIVKNKFCLFVFVDA